VIQKSPPQKSKKHLDFIRGLSCCVCLNPIETEAAHVRMSVAMAGKLNPGVGAKPHDSWTVPLCGRHHREQHEGSEPKFWQSVGIDPLSLAKELHANSGDHLRCEQIIRAQQSERV
jgi:hypothetical protein